MLFQNNQNAVFNYSFPYFWHYRGQPAVRAHKRKQKLCRKECHENINHLLVNDL